MTMTIKVRTTNDIWVSHTNYRKIMLNCQQILINKKMLFMNMMLEPMCLEAEKEELGDQAKEQKGVREKLLGSMVSHLECGYPTWDVFILYLTPK